VLAPVGDGPRPRQRGIVSEYLFFEEWELTMKRL
jgi:hypothetical protein